MTLTPERLGSGVGGRDRPVRRAADRSPSCARCGVTSRSWPAPCATAGRWSTSTPARRRRSRPRCWTPSASSTSGTTRPCTAGRTSWPRRPPTPSRRPGPAVAGFIGADPDEVVFTKNATEGINLVAYAMSNAADAPARAAERFVLGPGDEIVVTEMEHHANLVPWQELCRRTGATLRWLEVDRRGHASTWPGWRRWSPSAPRSLAFAHVSNVLGTLNPVAPLVARAREVGALVVLDACQSVPHLPVDVTDARRGLPGLLRAQDARPERGRRALGPPRAARGHAAVPDRRLDDRDGPDGGLDVRRRRRSGSRPACRWPRRRSGCTPRSTT